MEKGRPSFCFTHSLEIHCKKVGTIAHHWLNTLLRNTQRQERHDRHQSKKHVILEKLAKMVEISKLWSDFILQQISLLFCCWSFLTSYSHSCLLLKCSLLPPQARAGLCLVSCFVKANQYCSKASLLFLLSENQISVGQNQSEKYSSDSNKRIRICSRQTKL